MAIPIKMQSTPGSTRCYAIGYDVARERLYVTFRHPKSKGGGPSVTCVYDDFDAQSWYAFSHAPSKGKAVNQYLGGRNYRVL